MAKKSKSVNIEKLIKMDQLKEILGRFTEDSTRLLLGFRDFRRAVSEFDMDFGIMSDDFTAMLSKGINFWKSFASIPIGKSSLGIGYDDNLLERIGSRLTLSFVESMKRQSVEGLKNTEDGGTSSVEIINPFDRSGYDLTLANDLLATLDELRNEVSKAEEAFMESGRPQEDGIFEGLGIVELASTEGYLERIISYLGPIRDELKTLHDRHLETGINDVASYRHLLEELGIISPYDSEESQQATLNMSYTELQHSIDELSLRLKTLVFGEGGDGRSDIRNEQDFIRILENTISGDKVSDTSLSSAMPFVNELKKLQKQRNFLGAIMGIEDARSNIQTQINQARKYLDSRANGHAAEAQAMRDFLKEYGTFQQQKLAIAEDYAEKIRKAQSDGDRLMLEKERDRQLEQVDVQAIKQSIDWGSLFGEFGAMFKDQLDPTLEKLRAITQSEGFKKSSVEDQQIVYELISKLEASATVWDGEIFKRVSEEMETYQNAMQDLIAAQEREKEVYAETAAALRTAQANLLAARTNGDKDATAFWQAEVTHLTNIQRAASDKVEAFSRAANAATVNLKASADRAKNMFEGLESAISGLTSGSLKGVGQSLMQFDKLFGGGETTKKVGNALAKVVQGLFGKDSGVSKALSSALGKTGMMGDILSAVLGIFDTILENGISGIVTSLQDTIFGAVENLLDDVFSGAIITKPLGNMMEHLNHILDAVSFGGFSKLTSWLGDGDSDKHLERDLERLSQSNEDLKQAIDNLSDELGEAKMSNVEGLYEQQQKNIQEMEKNVQESMARSGAAYTNGHWYKAWTDGHHSSNKKINDGMSSSEWDAISKLLGKSVRSASDFWALSSKEMYEVATKLTSEYTHLKDLANDGYKDAAQFMDDYITYWKELEEIENAYREKMTGLSFDSARSSFNSLVKDVKNGTKEMLASVDDMFEDAILNWLMSESYSDRLQDWYERFAEYMKDGLEKWEADELRTWYSGIFDDMNRERDAAYAAAGIDPDDSGTTQSGRAGAFETMTQDQGTKLEGLFTSGQRHWASMDELLGKIADRWGGLMDRLGELVENTSYCRKLEGIADDIKTMRRDGIKMR